MREAVTDRLLFLHFQPQVDLSTGRVTGAEALLRWDRRDHGMVPPDLFIALAEETGLISEIGEFVLSSACAEAIRWPERIGVSVNVSPTQFRLPMFVQSVAEILSETGLASNRLEIEVTEGVMMDDTEETLAILGKLHAFGVRLALDDFGTGYSSLSYLQKFHFDKIKIDKSFVGRLGDDINAAAIVRAVMGLSEALGVCINAEGVETALQADLLRAEGCHEVQGYLYGRPIPATAFEKCWSASSLWLSSSLPRRSACGPVADCGVATWVMCTLAEGSKI